MAYETIKYEVDDQILTITLNRPDKLNAFNGTMQPEMIDAFDAADKDDNVRAIIVTGAGRGFCAGADLSAGATLRPRRAARAGEAARQRRSRLQRSPGARRRRPGDAADLQMPQAGHRGGEWPRRRHRRHHAACDGHPHCVRSRALRLRVLSARHRAGGRLELVPAAYRRHLAGARMVLFRPRVSGAGSIGRPPCQQGGAAGRFAADRARIGKNSPPRPHRYRWR